MVFVHNQGRAVVTVQPEEAPEVKDSWKVIQAVKCRLNDFQRTFADGIRRISKIKVSDKPNEAEKVRIALLEARRDPVKVCREIGSYNIQSQSARIEIAKAVAETDGEVVSHCIENFNISDEDARVEIAMIACSQSIDSIHGYFQNYQIKSEQNRIMLAKHYATCDTPSWIGFKISDFQIEDQEALLDIGRRMLSTSPRRLLFLLNSFGFEDQAVLIDFARRAAPNQGCLKLLATVGIQDRAEFLQIARIAAAYEDPVEVPKYFRFAPPESKIEEFEIVSAAFYAPICAGRPFDVSCGDLGYTEEEMRSLVVAYCKAKSWDPGLADPLDHWTLYMLGECGVRGLSQDETERALKQAAPLTTYHDPSMRQKLGSDIAERFRLCQEPLPENGTKKPRSEISSMLIHLAELRKLINEETRNKLMSLAGHSDFKDGPRQRIFERFVSLIINDHELSDQSKKSLLEQMARFPKVKELVAFCGIAEAAMKMDLQKFDEAFQGAADPSEAMKRCERILVEEACPGLHGDVNAYAKTLAGYRVPFALSIYAAKLKDLPPRDRERAQQAFHEFVVQILEDPTGETFRQTRYGSNHPHLDLLSPARLEAWKKGETSAWGEISEYAPEKCGKWTFIDTDSPEDLLLCGTEIAGSCQTIHGQPDKVKGLLGYLIDGKNRMIAIKDESGRIRARCLFSILLTQEGEPVLMLETMYTAKMDREAEIALERFAVRRAQALGMRMFSQVEPIGYKCSPYPNPLRSVSEAAPFEYRDSCGSIQQGPFSVSNLLEWPSIPLPSAAP